MHQFQPATIGDARGFQRIAALIALFVAALTVVGLIAGIDLLTRWIPSSTTMNPIAAALLILGATVMLLPETSQRRAMPLVAAAMVAAGVLKLGQAALGRPLGFDQLASLAFKHGTILPDALALNTATAFILLGLALAIGRTERPARAIAAQILAISAIAIAVMALAGFALDAAAINQLTFNRMAVNTAVAISAFGIAVLTLNPANGVMRLLLIKGPSGTLARIALPICLLVPVALGVARLTIERPFGLTTGDGVAIMVAGNIALTLGLLWGSLILLQKSDAELRAKALALLVSEDQYRHAGRIGKMGHWHFDVVNHQLHWTNEFRTLLDLPPDLQPSFDVINDRIHPDDREQARRLMRRARSDGEDWNWQVRLIGSDDKVRFFTSHGTCRRGADGAIHSIFGVFADVTELEEARRSAEAGSVAQASFLANMSHEIRTPLNGVLGFIDLVLDSELDPTQRRYLELVRESAQVLLKLLNDILDLSKVEAGHIDIAPQATDLRRSIRHAVRLMMPVAEQKKIALSVDVDPTFPAAVMVDGERVRQILLNLLGNALKFTDEGRVAVSLGQISDSSATPPMLRIAVVDTGVGIPAERKAAVFDAFVQADNSTSRRFGGSGLGLSISRQLAALMGGTITLDSQEGVGTTAELLLPLVAASQADVEAAEAADRTGPHGPMPGPAPGGGEPQADAPVAKQLGWSVLLVEDVPFNREVIGEMLRRLGYRVEYAVDGADALTKAARLSDDPQAWNLILMDIQMPVMNGKDSARAIRALGGAGAEIPIIALSANAFPGEIQQSFEAGMDDHVVKPVGFAELRRTVETWAPPNAACRAQRQGSRAAVR